jgi:hypothetical protein
MVPFESGVNVKIPHYMIENKKTNIISENDVLLRPHTFFSLSPDKNDNIIYTFSSYYHYFFIITDTTNVLFYHPVPGCCLCGSAFIPF